MMSWWSRASTEQRLAQIDGGIECGLNASQIAFNCGLRGTDRSRSSALLHGFASYHGRKFGREDRRGVAGREYAAERASCEGKKRTAALYGSFTDDAFSIFGNEPQDEILSWGER